MLLTRGHLDSDDNAYIYITQNRSVLRAEWRRNALSQR